MASIAKTAILDFPDPGSPTNAGTGTPCFTDFTVEKCIAIAAAANEATVDGKFDPMEPLRISNKFLIGPAPFTRSPVGNIKTYQG